MVLGDTAAPFGSKLLASVFRPKYLLAMGHTLRQGTSGLMFFLLLALPGLLCFISGRQVTKGVREVVTLSCDYNISVNELDRARVYWQKDKQMVLSIIAGTVKVWNEYKNRTILDIPNKLSLVILTLRLSDRGTYTCVVQQSEKGMFKLQHLSSVTLFLTADFLTPRITDLGNISTDIKRIVCSTSGGFPKPHLSWLEDGEEINTNDLTVSQDPQTELFTVSSELDFNMTSNHSFQCLVTYGNTAVSETFTWQKSQPPNAETTDNKFSMWMSFLIAILVMAVIALVALVHNRSAPRRRERRRNDTSLQMRTIYSERERPQAE